MKLVFINRYFHPDLSATSQLLSDLAFRLVREGHDVHVVCSRQLYEDPRASLAVEQCIEGVTVHRAWSTRFGRGSMLGRAIDYFSFYFGAYRTLRRVVEPGSVLIAKTDPPLVSVIAARVAKQRNARLVNWLQDLFPEVAQRMGMRCVGGATGRVLTWLRDRSLRDAIYNVVIGERMREAVLGRGVESRSVGVIPNWSDAKAILPIQPVANELRDEWELRGKFVVMYSGNLGRAHEFDTMLDAAELLRERPEIVFLCVGGGARKAYVVREVANRGLSNVLFKPYQPMDRLAASLGAADVHLITLLPAQEGLVVPSKFYGVMAAGRPTLFVGDQDGELARSINRHAIGASVACGDAKELANQICRLSAQSDLAAAMGSRARQVFEAHYSETHAVHAWLSVFRHVARAKAQMEQQGLLASTPSLVSRRLLRASATERTEAAPSGFSQL